MARPAGKPVRPDESAGARHPDDGALSWPVLPHPAFGRMVGRSPLGPAPHLHPGRGAGHDRHGDGGDPGNIPARPAGLRIRRGRVALQPERTDRSSLCPRRWSPRCGLLHSCRRPQHRRLPRPAAHRRAGRTGELAMGLCRSLRLHGAGGDHAAGGQRPDAGRYPTRNPPQRPAATGRWQNDRSADRRHAAHQPVLAGAIAGVERLFTVGPRSSGSHGAGL